MKTYIGMKVIQAQPMTLSEFNATHSKVIPASVGEDGYEVIYPYGYISWSPKHIFEAAYRELSENEKSLCR